MAGNYAVRLIMSYAYEYYSLCYGLSVCLPVELAYTSESPILWTVDKHIQRLSIIIAQATKKKTFHS